MTIKELVDSLKSLPPEASIAIRPEFDIPKDDSYYFSQKEIVISLITKDRDQN